MPAAAADQIADAIERGAKWLIREWPRLGPRVRNTLPWIHTLLLIIIIVLLSR